MVRETRHLWVGNLPDNIREDRIREHFKRYGRVQSVKLLPRSSKEETSEGTMACTVAFMDIKSASKAHNTEHKVDDRTLTTEYYEPAAIPSAASPQTSPYSTSPGSNRFPNGHSSADEHVPFVERYYDRGSGGGVVLGGVRSVTESEFPTSRRNAAGIIVAGGGVGGATGVVGPGVPYHDVVATSRGGRNRDRGFRNGPYNNVIIDRGSHRTTWCYEGGGGNAGGGAGAGAGGRYNNNSQNEIITGYNNNNGATLTTTVMTGTTAMTSTPTAGAATAGSNAGAIGTAATTTTTTTSSGIVVAAAAGDVGGGGVASERRGTSDQSTKKKTKSRSGSRSMSPSGSNSSRSPSRSRSRSSSSSSSSSTSRTSSTSSPKSRRTAANSHLAHSDDRRPLAICVKNLPLRSSDTSLKDGLYHEYKKHGKVTSVKVVGQNSERHAIVCFKKPEDVEKALEVSYDKLFFGCKIDVAPYQGYDVEDNDLRPYEAEIDEYHPKATRTLFIGNLEKDVTASDLRKTFDQFGEIIEIDIKNQGNVSLYAFCQYSDIVSVVKAIRKMDGEHLGNNRIKLGFGKSMPTNVVWVDGVGEHVQEKYLRMQFDPFGPISKISVDRDRGQALIFYEQMVGAQSAVSKMRGYNLKGNKIQVDFASRECQQSFYEHLEKQGAIVEERRDSTSRSFDSGRYARYDTPTRARTSSYSSRSSVAASQVTSAIPSPGTPGSVTPRGGTTASSKSSRLGRFADYYDSGELLSNNDRHFLRSYDEYSQGSAASQDDPYDPDYGYGNHDASPISSHLDVISSSMQGVCAVEHLHDRTMVTAIPPYGGIGGTTASMPDNIRNLQKERVHLLEQLEECPSSGDEHNNINISSKKRIKLDLLDGALGTDVMIIEANRDHHRKVMEVRRLSDVSLSKQHHSSSGNSSRRPSIDNNSGKHSRELTHSAYVPHAICKRRKTGGSDAGSRVQQQQHHYDHSGSESVGGSRPGTPLCDERPENFPPSEPRRVPRDRDGPLTLPLPRFASQIMGRGSVSVAGIKGQKDNHVLLSSPPPSVTSPRISSSSSSTTTTTATATTTNHHHHHHQHQNPKPSSPVHEHVHLVPPPASPPPRPPSLSSNSSDSDAQPPSPSLDERIRSLDEKYEKWSGSRALSAAGGDALAKLDATREKFRLRHKLLDFDLKEVQPSEIVKSVMAKRSVFDEDLKRLENVGEKYEPSKEFQLFARTATTIAAPKETTAASSTTVPSAAAAAAIKITSPGAQMPKTPTLLSPRSTGNSMIPVKGLQYPFPSHPPIQTPPAATALPPQQTPPAATNASPTQQIQQAAASTTTRSANAGENRLKPCASASSDNRICSSKVNVNRSAVLNSVATPPIVKNSEKTSANNIPIGEPAQSANVVEAKVNARTIIKHNSDKITCRRDSAGSSPRGDVKSRRNSDVGTRRTEDAEKISDTSLETDQKSSSERAKSEERKNQQQQYKEKLRLENERLERERLEKEQQEKERLEKERLEREKQEREKELEKERLAEKKRLEKERAEQERLERERREREEQERHQERARREQEQQRLREEREEAERREREIKERLEHERQAKKEQEKLEREKRREEEKKHKEDNHDRRIREEHKHRENHGETKQQLQQQQHKDNNVNLDKSNNPNNEQHNRTKQSSKEEKEKAIHEIFRRNDSHDRNNSDKLKNIDKETELRRKESIKENRDNNTHEKQRHNNDAKDIESRHLSIDLDKPRSESNKKRERNNSLPGNIGIKRRMSSQEGYDNSAENNKKPKLQHSDQKKISDRRDSKDSVRSEDRAKCKVKNNVNVKSSDEKSSFHSDKTNHSRESETEKRKEKDKDKDKEDKHNKSSKRFEKQKTKSKSREKDPTRESPVSSSTTNAVNKELTDKDFLAKLELRSNEDIEKQRDHKREKRKQESSSSVIDFDVMDRGRDKDKEDKRSEEKSKRDRPSDKNKQPKDELQLLQQQSQSSKMNDEKMKHQRKSEKEKIRKVNLNSSDNNTDSDEPKKHSIFDIVDDEPAYISMYDKVKARSCKNMQKQEEEKRQEKIKAKFSQLKQSRAKREEKKRSTSWDEDSESDREKNDSSKSRRNKMLIVSSEDEFSDLGKLSSSSLLHKQKRDIFTDSDSDRVQHRQHKNDILMMDAVSDEDYVRHHHKSRKTSRSTNELISDDDVKNVHPIKTELFSENESVDRCSSDHDFKHFKVKDEFAIKKSIKKERKASSKQEDSFDKLDNDQQLLLDLKPPLTEIKPEKVNNRHILFDNSSADENTEFKKEKSKKHKKKQKRLKHSLSSEDSSKFDSLLDSSQIESLEKIKHHDKKRQHSKKDKKRDKSKERDKSSKKSKRSSKSTSKSDFKSHDGKMENIFGSLSDSSDNGVRDSETTTMTMVDANNKVNKFLGDFNDENVPSSIFSDSDMEKAVKIEEIDAKEEHRKRKERRRKEKERRLQEAAAAAALAEAAVHFNENSMDFADLGKQLEDNIKDEPADHVNNLDRSNTINTETDTSTFNYYDGGMLYHQEYKKEDRKDGREKKKKRKKSKEERQKHHHHHDKNKVKTTEIIIKKEYSCSTTEEPSMPILQESNPPSSQSLPSLLDSPPQEKIPEKSTAPVEKEPIKTSSNNAVQPSSSSTAVIVQSSPISSQVGVQSKEKKREKFIPGFGAEIDETVHENAVKSIAEFDTINKPTESCSSKVIEETDAEKTVEEAGPEEKPRAVISQEETEDAVAALLGESFSNERYSEDDLSGTNDQTSALVEEPNVQDDEEMRQAVQSLGAADLEVKPDTPQSEHELQIDTDTEEQDDNNVISIRFDQQPKTPDMSELLRPPKTPDIPTYFRSEESKTSSLSPLVIKAPPNIGSPPSLAPITPHPQQPSVMGAIKRSLDVVMSSEGSCKIPPLTVPPLVEPARTVISQPWSSAKSLEETSSSKSVDPKMATTKVLVTTTTSITTMASSQQPQNIMTTMSSPLITSTPLRTYPPMVKISESSFPPLTAISKQETPISKPDALLSPVANTTATLPILQVATAPALHNLPARSPVPEKKSPSSNNNVPSATPQELMPLGGGAPKIAAAYSKIRLPITSVVVSKPIQATALNLPQAKVAFSSSEPPKLIPTQDPRPRMIFQNAAGPFPFSSTAHQKMVVQTNIPMARGLLVPARPGHFNYIPSSQVAFGPEKSTDLSKSTTVSTANSGSSMIHASHPSPSDKIQIKHPQSIIISPNSHIPTTGSACLINNQKITRPIIPEAPPTLVAISSATDVQSSTTIVPQQKIAPSPVCSVEAKRDNVETKQKPLSSVNKDKETSPLEPTLPISEEASVSSSSTVDRKEDKSELPIIKTEEEEKPQQLAIEKVTEELNLALKKAKDSEFDRLKEESSEIQKKEIMSSKLVEEAKPEIKSEENTASVINTDAETTILLPNKESEKLEEEKTDSESIVSDISKDCSSADIPMKDLLDNREDKEDSDYWSPKDVNIDSVIKTLCSADELSNHSNDNGNSKDKTISEDSTTNKVSSEKEKIDLESANIRDHLDNNKELLQVESNKSDSETMDDSVEDNEEKDSTRIGTRRGGRGGRGRKGRGVERGGIQTRRGKILSKDAPTPTTKRSVNTPSSRGGKAKVERKATKSESEAPADIYEFREDEENRPRLILTIKQSNTNSAAVQSSAVVKEVPKETVIPPQQPPQQQQLTPSNKPTSDNNTKEKVEEFAQPSANTRKSRRLQEKDISRTTVDDTIEDVVKNTAVVMTTRSNSQTTPRRSARQPQSNAAPKTTLESPRKSPRGRRIGRRASEASDEVAEETKEKIKAMEPSAVNKTSSEAKVVLETEKPKLDQSTLSSSSAAPSSVVVAEKEPTTTTAPASNNKETVIEKPPIGLKAAVLRRVKGEMGQEPMTLIDPVTGLLTPMRECEENKYIPVPGDKKPGTNVINTMATAVATTTTTTTTSPVAMVTTTTVSTETAKAAAPQIVTTTAITTTTIPSSQPLVAAVKPQPAKPQSLKAHVLSSQAAQAIVTQQLPTAQKHSAVIGRATPPTTIVSTTSESKVAVNLPPTQSLNVNVSAPNYGPVHLSPRTNNIVVPNVVGSPKQPMTVKQPMASPSQMYNLMAQQHKQLLQIGKSTPMTTTSVIPKGIVVSTASIMKHQQQQQQPIMKQVPLSKVSKSSRPIHLPAGAGIPGSVLGKTQPVQPMVAGAPNRMMQQGKGPMEPPKVDVAISNLLSVRGLSSLSPQGQPRLLTQSGMAVPGYEASLAETIPHFPPGSVTLRPPHDLPPPHYLHPSHMYQQYLRQSYHFPRSSLVPGGIEKQQGDGQEGEEAPVTSPPLELRMPGSVGIPTLSIRATVPHGLHSPHDRATDSPQVGQVYNMQTARMQHYNHRYYEAPAEPPPAHRPVTSHSSLAALGGDRPPPMSHGMAALGAAGPHLPPGAPGHLSSSERPLSGGHPSLAAAHLPLGTPERPSSSHLPPDRPLSSGGHNMTTPVTVMPDRPVSAHGMTMGAAGNLMGAVARHIGVDAPASQRGLQAATPPHASQVPPQADSLYMLLKQYPRMWQGLLALKNDQAAVQMYFVSGNDDVAKCSLPKNTDGSTPPLRIFQRMRLEPPQVEGVARKMQMEKEHCMLLALPCGHDHMDVLKQSTNLTNGFITYLQQKQAAGIVNVAAPGTTQPPAYVVHIFPSCNFVNENLRRIAPSLLERVADIAHLLIVITTV